MSEPMNMHPEPSRPEPIQRSTPGPGNRPVEKAPARQPSKGLTGTRVGYTWTALVVGALTLIVLLIFILQNSKSVPVTFLFWEFSLPVGVGTLLAAIAGALIMAVVGGLRILQIRRAAKRL